MPKPQLLLVDRDAKSLRVLKVSLEQAGYEVATATDGLEAVAQLERRAPEVVLAATELPRLDGYGLVRRMKDRPAWTKIPVVLLTEKVAIEDKIRGLELGVDEYLSKPIFVRELLAKLRGLTARRVLDRVAQVAGAHAGVVAGSLSDVAIVDLLETLARCEASGTIRIADGKRRGEIFCRAGAIIDATLERLRGEEAVFRALVWSRGSFELEAGEPDRTPVIERSTAALLDAALGYMAEWNRLTEALPSLDAVMSVDRPELGARLGAVPAELDGILQLLDGTRPLYDVIDDSPFDDLSTLETVAKLYAERLAFPVGVAPDASRAAEGAEGAGLARNKRDTHPWLEAEGGEANRAVVADAAAVSETTVAVPASDRPTALMPNEPSRRLATPTPAAEPAAVAEGGAEAGGDAKVEAPHRPEPEQAPATPPPATPPTRKGSKKRAEGRKRDFDAAVADQAVESLVAEPHQGGEVKDDRVIVTARGAGAKPTPVPAAPAPSDAPAAPEPPAPAEAAASPQPAPAAAPPSAPVTLPAQPSAPPAEPDGASRAAAAAVAAAASSVAIDGGAAPPILTTLRSALTEESVPGLAVLARMAAEERAAEERAAEQRAAEEHVQSAAPPKEEAPPASTPPAPAVEPAPTAAGPAEPPAVAEAPARPAPAEGAEDEEDEEREQEREPRALSESGVSHAFFQSLPSVEEQPPEEPPFSVAERPVLTAEQVARRTRLMRLVGIVLGLLVALMAFIFWVDWGKKEPARPPASSSARAATTAPKSVWLPTTSAPSTSSSASATPTEPLDAGVAAPDAGAVDAGAEAVDGGGEELPQVEDPFKEAVKLTNQGRYKDAIPMAKAAIKADPDKAEAYMYLAEAYRALGKTAEMQAAYDECVQRPAKGAAANCPYGHKK